VSDPHPGMRFEGDNEELFALGVPQGSSEELAVLGGPPTGLQVGATRGQLFLALLGDATWQTVRAPVSQQPSPSADLLEAGA